MKCGFCQKAPVYMKRTSNEYFCEEHFIRYAEKIFKKTLRKHNMLSKNDRIAVAISGGKDSGMLLHLLENITKRRKNTELFALILDEGIKGYRDESIKYAERLCQKLDVPLHKISLKKEMKITIDELAKRGVKTCTYCGIFKRYLLNKKARELKATKLFVGHNLDDEAQSILMNFFRGDYSRFLRLGASPYTVKRKGFVPRYKPMINLTEKEIALYAALKKIPFYEKRCLYSFDNVRRDTLEKLNELDEKYPGTKQNIISFYEKIRKELPDIRGEIGTCKKCGEPSNSDLCKVCELLDFLRSDKSP